MPRIVLLGLDGFPYRAIRRDLTPRLWALSEAGGRAPEGGVTDLPSSTDPGFCSLLTGCFPKTHGVRTTAWRYARLPDWAGSQRPRVPTIFDACKAAGIESAAMVGDDRGLLCTDAADHRWPPAGPLPTDITLDAHGYPVNAEVRPHLLNAAADPSIDFLVGHLNESDTIGHDFGPESEAARECYAATDRLVGEILDALAVRWAETIVVVVSDHDMQPRDASPPIELIRHGGEHLWDLFIPDGGAALVHLRPAVDPATAADALRQIDGIESTVSAADSVLIAGAKPGRIFSAPALPAGGFHGAPATARTLALVGGGHPAVGVLARNVHGKRPHLADWMPTVAPLLGLELPRADGKNLMA